MATAVRELQLINDRLLLDRARRGDVSAHDELWRRHAPVLWRLAVAVSRQPAGAEPIVVAAWTSVVASSAAVTSVTSVRAMLLAAVRHAAQATPSTQATPVRGLVSAAFTGLPERLRSALWLIDVEQLPPSEVAGALEIEGDAVAPLGERARGALAEQVVAVAADPVAGDPCGAVLGKLTAYTAGRLSARDTAKVRVHVEDCERCRLLLAALDELTPRLGRLALPVPLALATTARDAWRKALVQERGPLGLMWLGGQPLPAWTERALAGAAAAVVAFGISTAVILAGRDNRGGDGRIARQDAMDDPLGTPDGESALGTDDPLSGQIPGAEDAPVSAPSGDAGGGSGGQGGGAALPRGVTPQAPAAPTDTIDPTSPVAPAPTPPAPPAPSSSVQVGVSVPGVVDVAVGDQCTGVDLLGTVLGCDPPESDSLLDLGGSLLGG